MTHELLVMRHCKSSWRDETLPDEQRPLTARGKADAAAMGRLLAERRLLPDLAISSPAKRARSTLKRLARAASYKGPTRVEPALYQSTPQRVLAVLAAVPDSQARVLVVGHNPTLEELVQLLTGREVALPTGAVASIALAGDRWARIELEERGTLLGVITPSSIGGQAA